MLSEGIKISSDTYPIVCKNHGFAKGKVHTLR